MPREKGIAWSSVARQLTPVINSPANGWLIFDRHGKIILSAALLSCSLQLSHLPPSIFNLLTFNWNLERVEQNVSIGHWSLFSFSFLHSLVFLLLKKTKSLSRRATKSYYSHVFTYSQLNKHVKYLLRDKLHALHLELFTFDVNICVFCLFSFGGIELSPYFLSVEIYFGLLR